MRLPFTGINFYINSHNPPKPISGCPSTTATPCGG